MQESTLEPVGIEVRFEPIFDDALKSFPEKLLAWDLNKLNGKRALSIFNLSGEGHAKWLAVLMQSLTSNQSSDNCTIVCGNIQEAIGYVGADYVDRGIEVRLHRGEIRTRLSDLRWIASEPLV